MLTLADCLGSRYLFNSALLDAGFNTGQATIATVVLFGPSYELPGEEEPLDEYDHEWEPAPRYEPDERDLADFLSWSDRRDTQARLAARDEADDRHRTTLRPTT